MGIGGTLRTLGRFLDACEAHGSVTRVDLLETDTDSDVPISAAIDIELPICSPSNEAPELTPSQTTVRPDGTLAVTYDSEGPRLPLDDHDVDVDVTETAHVDGTTTVSLRATVATTASDTNSTTASTTNESPRAGLDPTQDPTTESTIAITVGSGDSQTTNEPESPQPSPSERDVPPFRDTALLREVYESCETFAEMPDALGMDVTAETVRRYMIRQGIHEPTSYNTSADEDTDATTADAETAGSTTTANSGETSSGDDGDANRPADTESGGPDEAKQDRREPEDSSAPATDDSERPSQTDVEPPAVLADGIGLPEDVTIDTIVEAVQTSNTIYEVKQGIGVEREDALELLTELNLLEFVAGRLATEAEREVGREQIIDRLREQADAL